jgi:general transcriptional corepressor CYC8
MQRHNYSKAYEAYQQAVYRDSRNSNFWCSIGVLYWEINQFRDALDAYTRAIRLNPYIPEIWFNLGTLYEACNNQIQDAIDAYNRAYELDNNYYIVEERLNILKRNLETGRNDGPPPPRPSDIDPQRYEDFLQNQANQQNVAQLQGMQQNWGPPPSSAPPPNQHRTVHQPPPHQPTPYPPRRSPDQPKAIPYSHPPPPPSSYSNGNSGYGRPAPPPVSVKRGSSPPPPSFGYESRPPMNEPPLNYPRHDEMTHRPPHLPPSQNYVSPRQHERELVGPGGIGGSFPPPPTRSPISSYPSRNRSPPPPISQHGPPPDVKPILDQGLPASPSNSHGTHLAPLQSIRSPGPTTIPPLPRNDAAAYPLPPDPIQKREWDRDREREYNREPSRASPHSRIEPAQLDERRRSQERLDERRPSPQQARSHGPTPPRPRSPLISPRTTEPSYPSAPSERKSPLSVARMDVDSPQRHNPHGEEPEKMQVEEDRRPEPEAPARSMDIDEDYDKEDERPEEK